MSLSIFNSYLEDLLILYRIGKAPYSHYMILVCDSIDISHLNNILTLGNCIGERLKNETKVETLEVVLRYWSYM